MCGLRELTRLATKVQLTEDGPLQLLCLPQSNEVANVENAVTGVNVAANNHRLEIMEAVI